MIRVFVIDDHPWIIDGLKHKFRSSRDEIKIIGNAARISKVLDHLKDEDFDLFILDLWLGDADPIDNVKKLQAKFLYKPIIIFTYEKSTFWEQQMFALGVKGYLNKEIDKSELKAAIIKVSQGELIFSDISFLEDESSGKSHNVESNLILKPFEKEIFKLLTSGMSQQNIANRQLITLSAIEKVIRKVKKQFNVKSISELIHILTIRKEI